MSNDMLSMNGINKSFNKLHVLKGIDINIGPGEIYSLIGPNGAGKTTTVRIALGTMTSDEGTIRICGMDPIVNRTSALRQVGFMLERPCMNIELSLDDNLNIYQRIYRNRNDIKGIDKVVGLTKLNKWRSISLSKYSKGMLQKAALCRALLHNPKLLVLDEPSSGMDPILQEELRAILTQFRDSGNSILLCSHDLLEVERMCTHVGILNEGRIVRAGSVSDVIASCKFNKYRIEWNTNAEAVAARNILSAQIIVRSDIVEDATITVLIPDNIDINQYYHKMSEGIGTPTRVIIQDLSLSDVFFCDVLNDHIQEGGGLA